MTAAGDKWRDVAEAATVAEGEVRTFAVGGERLAIARTEGTLYAVQDRCSHDDGPLGEGCLEGYAVRCPRHGARFDVRTGAVLAAPAVVGIGTFAVREMNGRIEVTGVADNDEDDW
jgi:3-phenylpropionate/trans-cinnamate dioxygenase ferredoxin subunit